MFRVAVLIDYERFRAWWQDLQRLQEFNDVVLQVWCQGIECQPLGKSLPVVSFNSFPGGGEFPVVHERSALIVEAPQLASNEFAVPSEETWRSGRLVLVEGLAFRIFRWVADADVMHVMQLQIGVRGHHYHTAMCPQAGERKRIARKVHGESRSTHRVIRGPERAVR